jgi:PAS domain S-box-containing protein
VADSVPNIIFVYDLQTQKNVYVNREITTLLGYSAEQIQQMGNRMLDNLIHPDDISLVHERSALILADRELETHEVIYRIRSAGGEWRWLRDVCKLFKRDAQGKPWQILGVTEDITSRKRAE